MEKKLKLCCKEISYFHPDSHSLSSYKTVFPFKDSNKYSKKFGTSKLRRKAARM